MIELNEYLNFVRMAEDGEVQPPFSQEDVDAAEYYHISFSDAQQAYHLVLTDGEGKEIAGAYWEDLDFMLEYFAEYYGVDIDEEELDNLNLVEIDRLEEESDEEE